MRVSPSQSEIDSLISKFILNLPKSELREQRIWVHMEKALYFFIDQMARVEPMDDFDMHKRESREFFHLMAERLPSFVKLDGQRIASLIDEGYNKTPVYGVLIFNLEETKVLLVESHKPALMFGVPKGKINEGETPAECAVREVREEVGINIEIDPSRRVEIELNKFSVFFLCNIEECNINVMVNKNSELDRATGKKRLCKEVKSIAWIDLKNPGVRLNGPTRKALEILNSDKKGKMKYFDNDNLSKNGMYRQVVNPFQSYKLNRKMHENIFMAEIQQN